MMKSIDVTGKTEEEAIASALLKLGLERDEVSVEILELAKTGFLGLGASPAKIRVNYEAPDDRQEKAQRYISGLLTHMGVRADIKVSERENGRINISLSGNSMGVIIGRRGETLDAIQHLVNYSINRGSEKHTHISVDAENYRSKREDSLVRLAEKMAAKAVKYRRSMALEPMNSYERHVIHTALQNYEGVSTSSTGTEPNRRVVVNYEKPQQKPNKPEVREWS
jgi:spoIIIJ-associated protein